MKTRDLSKVCRDVTCALSGSLYTRARERRAPVKVARTAKKVRNACTALDKADEATMTSLVWPL